MLSGLFVIGLIVALSIVIYRRGYSGYRAAPTGLAKLHRGEAVFVEAVAEVLFPGGAGLVLSGIDAQLPRYIDRHLDALPRAQRIQIHLLFAAVEHLTLVLPGDEPGGRRRFSSLTAASRIALLGRLADHPNGSFRLLFVALRSVFILGYLGHPANLHGLGLAPFEIEPAVSDAELLFPRVGGLVSSIAFEIEDRTDPTRSDPLEPDGRRHRAYARAGRNS
ncbi:MAG: gluconate 2-dehydrogenase subunit 3 family protein [bacterium]|nr:hypothetical protein [Deltaproteobacteria bacterium]MCP4906578.1 gluconate 2-dehydrogenase subunit 3 family protein [bacterium]